MTCLALTAIGLHLASLHSRPHFNGINPGAFIRTECGLIGGVFYNSVRKPAVYIGYAFDPADVPVFATVSLSTGYKGITGWRITPLAMAGVKYPVGDYTIRLGVVPPWPGHGDVAVLHAMIERRF